MESLCNKFGNIEISDCWEYLILKNPEWLNGNQFTSKQLKNTLKNYKGKCHNKETRILCNYNHSSKRKKYLQDNNLCILPIKNGTYILTQTNIYYSLQYNIHKKNIHNLSNVGNINILQINGSGESNAIDLLITNNFEEIIFGEKKLYNTMGGRKYSKEFMINLDKNKLKINQVQYETDCLIETKHNICIIECKNTPNKLHDFNIKQLYYPFRDIKNQLDKIKSNKILICMLIHKIKNNIYTFTYKFNDIYDLTSIECVDKYLFKIPN